MKVENGKIVEATESEMYEYWLTRDWCEIFTFTEYLNRCKEHGTKIIDSMEQEGKRK